MSKFPVSLLMAAIFAVSISTALDTERIDVLRTKREPFNEPFIFNRPDRPDALHLPPQLPIVQNTEGHQQLIPRRRRVIMTADQFPGQLLTDPHTITTRVSLCYFT